MRCGCRSASQARRVRDVRSSRSLCGPQGTRRSTPGWEALSAAHRSAAMAGGARPDPFRTRKLSRRAPMVLRYRPWESRAPLTGGRRFPFFKGLARGGAAGGSPAAPPFSVSGPVRGLSRFRACGPLFAFSGTLRGLFLRCALLFLVTRTLAVRLCLDGISTAAFAADDLGFSTALCVSVPPSTPRGFLGTTFRVLVQICFRALWDIFAVSDGGVWAVCFCGTIELCLPYFCLEISPRVSLMPLAILRLMVPCELTLISSPRTFINLVLRSWLSFASALAMRFWLRTGQFVRPCWLSVHFLLLRILERLTRSFIRICWISWPFACFLHAVRLKSRVFPLPL